MNEDLPSINKIDISGKKVLVRGDFDVDDGDNPRADSIRKIVIYLKEKGAAKVRVIGHTETKYDLAGQLRAEFPDVEFDSGVRNNPGEKENNDDYARQLAGDFDIYINEAFATSHRKHASIVGVPRVIKERGGQVAIGLRFEKELEMFERVKVIVNSNSNSNNRSVLVIGGTKIDDKQKFVDDYKAKFGAVLTGGLLPGTDRRPDGLDITDAAIEKYTEEIGKAEVILAAGVMGKYEDPNSCKGTKTVLEAIANNTNAYKVAGGGDIEMAISTYGLTDKFNWISVGGGAMLVYLSTGTLVGLEALMRS